MSAHDRRWVVAVAATVFVVAAGCSEDTKPAQDIDAGDSDAGDSGAIADAGEAADGGGDGGDAGGTFCQSSQALDLSVCDPAKTNFSLTIDNPFYPLVVGQTSVFEGEEDGEKIHLEIEVLDETETVAGVETRVVEEREQHDGAIEEISRNFFAQSDDGTVCYFGEEVDIYEEGEVVAHEGAWRAGGQNRAGIVMPAHPKVGDFFAQEDAPGVAEDRAEIAALGKKVSVPAGDFTDTIETIECSPLEPGVKEPKSYARGVGLLVDDVAKLVGY
jgi:hypothetical protein